jgi:hypothetical protein
MAGAPAWIARSRLAIQVYELNSLHEHIERAEPVSNGNVNARLVPQRESELSVSEANGDLARVMAFSPEAISVHVLLREHQVLLRFPGLPSARGKAGKYFFRNALPGAVCAW